MAPNCTHFRRPTDEQLGQKDIPSTNNLLFVASELAFIGLIGAHPEKICTNYLPI